MAFNDDEYVSAWQNGGSTAKTCSVNVAQMMMLESECCRASMISVRGIFCGTGRRIRVSSTTE